MGKRWLSFDLDGTLMQNPFVSAVFPEIYDLINQQLVEPIDVTSLLVKKHLKRRNAGKFFEAYDWDNVVAELIDDLNLSLKINVTEIVKKHCVTPHILLLEDSIVESLISLKEKGYSLAAVTNGFLKYQYPVMEALNIKQLFEKVITPETCKTAKPDLLMLQTLDEEGEVIAHIGDRIDHDIVLANRFGTPSIFITKKEAGLNQNVPIEERIQHKEYLRLCEEKWQAETKGLQGPFNNEHKPNIIIYSIQELVNIL